MLFATGKRLTEITHADFDALAAAGACPAGRRPGGPGSTTGPPPRQTKTVLFHMGVLPALPDRTEQRWPFARRLAGVPEPMHSILVRYLQRKSVTCQPATGLVAGHPAGPLRALPRRHRPGRDPGHADPGATTSSRGWPRCPSAANTKTGGILSVPSRPAGSWPSANFLSEITEWDWPEAPTRRLLFPSDNPRLPQPLPRFLPPDADRRLTEALQASPNRLAADALLLQRACGLRIGELLDLELDAVIDIPGPGPG